MTIYAVNGKEPVSAWIPSLDTAGNGTTTLTDLVGSADGTLTNMDPATDWVADTDNGGVRALDFDGADDYVDTAYDPAFIQNTLVFAVSVWINRANTSPHFFFGTTLASAEKGAFIGVENRAGIGLNAIRVFLARGTQNNALDFRSPDNSITTGWHQVVVSGDGADVAIWIDGISQSVSTAHVGTWVNSTGPSKRTLNVGRVNFSSTSLPLSGRLDDIRIFDQSLDASDVAYLYNSGNGRGVTAAAAANPTAILQINSQSARVGL